MSFNRTSQYSMTQCRVLQITVSLTVTPQLKTTKLTDRRQSIHPYLPITHSSIHPYDIDRNATLWCSASKYLLITEDSVFQDGLSWLVQSGYTNVIMGQTTSNYLSVYGRPIQGKQHHTESKNVVACKIVTGWHVFTGQRAGHKQEFLVTHNNTNIWNAYFPTTWNRTVFSPPPRG